MKKLDRLIGNSVVVDVESATVFSDIHLGDKSAADDFAKSENAEMFLKTITNLLDTPNHTVVIAGDLLDLWQFKLGRIIREYDKILGKLLTSNRVIILIGNHDLGKGELESVILRCAGKKYFVAHGHQGDLMSDTLNKLSIWLVRYIWTPLEKLGIKEPPEITDKHISHEGKLIEWANEQEMDCIFGHTHRLKHRFQYYNSGCLLVDGELQGVSIDEHGIRAFRGR